MRPIPKEPIGLVVFESFQKKSKSFLVEDDMEPKPGDAVSVGLACPKNQLVSDVIQRLTEEAKRVC
jgi:hypothetical protein